MVNKLSYSSRLLMEASQFHGIHLFAFRIGWMEWKDKSEPSQDPISSIGKVSW